VDELGPWPAVEAFFDAFLGYARRKGAMLGELQQAFEKHPEFRSMMRERIEGAFAIVLDRARSADAIRGDVDGADVMALLGPVCSNAAIPPEQSRRLVGMILDGLRAPGAGLGEASATAG